MFAIHLLSVTRVEPTRRRPLHVEAILFEYKHKEPGYLLEILENLNKQPDICFDIIRSALETVLLSFKTSG